ncbi:uncharacterized protein PRD47_013720 isoform 1-T1 [Ara ararauna]
MQEKVISPGRSQLLHPSTVLRGVHSATKSSLCPFAGVKVSCAEISPCKVETRLPVSSPTASSLPPLDMAECLRFGDLVLCKQNTKVTSFRIKFLQIAPYIHSFVCMCAGSHYGCNLKIVSRAFRNS